MATPEGRLERPVLVSGTNFDIGLYATSLIMSFTHFLVANVCTIFR